MKSSFLLPAMALLASVVTSPAAQASATSYCREFNRDIVIDGRMQAGYGIACLQPDGSWEIQPSAQTLPYPRNDNVVIYEQPTTRYVTTTRRVDYVDPSPLLGAVALGSIWWGWNSYDHHRRHDYGYHHRHDHNCRHDRDYGSRWDRDRDHRDHRGHDRWDRGNHRGWDKPSRYSYNR
ncbi:MAG: hypothetical protein IT567_06780 [Alphaproteobacteria bacterium]|nr:hypothetical protein [Alphaproteobacteria bacterium]